MLILGIDDAGRGPLIGPMILSGVLIRKENERELKSEGVTDSKKLDHNTRIKLSGLIKDRSLNYKILSTSAEQIDFALLHGTNLNTLEAMKTAEIINFLTKGKKDKIRVIVDCPSVNISAWKITLLGFIEESNNLEIICEHKADLNHVSVSAASIIAKVAREEAITELKKEYGDFGSGYPSDPITQDFLKKQGLKLKNSGLFRKTWQTWRSLFPEKSQMTLRDFA